MHSEKLEYKEVFQERVFKNISHYTQLDPSILQGILSCVPSSGMRTTEADTLRHIKGDIVIVYIDDKSQKVFAFSGTALGTPNELLKSSDISDVYGCYLAGATVSKDKQGTGFYKKMNERRIGVALERKLELVFTRTQNPRVQSGIQAVLDRMREKGLITGYKLERILAPGCYSCMLTEEKPKDDKVSFDELDYEKGDAYVLLFFLQYIGDPQFSQEKKIV